MRLVAYIRVSTDEQAQQGHSLGQQPQRISAWAAAHGHEIVAVVRDEGVSASVPLFERPEGRRLLLLLAEGHATGVVAQRLDRLFRSARDGLAFAEDFAAAHGVSLMTVDGAIDTSTPGGWLTLAMQLVAAQYERLMDVQRARETSRSLRESGRVYGTVPFGCIERGGRLLRDPQAWAQREQIMVMRRVGMETRAGGVITRLPPMSYRDIRDTLRRMGVAAPAGGRWWSTATLRALVHSHSSLLHLPFASDPTLAPLGAPEAEVSP